MTEPEENHASIRLRVDEPAEGGRVAVGRTRKDRGQRHPPQARDIVDVTDECVAVPEFTIGPPPDGVAAWGLVMDGEHAAAAPGFEQAVRPRRTRPQAHRADRALLHRGRPDPAERRSRPDRREHHRELGQGELGRDHNSLKVYAETVKITKDLTGLYAPPFAWTSGDDSRFRTTVDRACAAQQGRPTSPWAGCGDDFAVYVPGGTNYKFAPMKETGRHIVDAMGNGFPRPP
ncbi:hypothetical protein GCM10010208_32250 [Actinomadura livida]|nr:hypothetical protein GCM10010208_32250 [Actinomadura livida]